MTVCKPYFVRMFVYGKLDWIPPLCCCLVFVEKILDHGIGHQQKNRLSPLTLSLVGILRRDPGGTPEGPQRDPSVLLTRVSKQPKANGKGTGEEPLARTLAPTVF